MLTLTTNKGKKKRQMSEKKSDAEVSEEKIEVEERKIEARSGSMDSERHQVSEFVAEFASRTETRELCLESVIRNPFFLRG